MNASITNNFSPTALRARLPIRRGLTFGLILVGALIMFEMFNFSTTEFAFHDLLGGLDFLGIPWSTILAIAFCGIDFAGIARLFTPTDISNEPNEVWYLFGAWLLAATMNAMLTWWGISIAILEHQSLGNAVVARETLLRVVPIFVAVLVWLIRVLIIGTFSVAGERLFSQSGQNSTADRRPSLVRPTSNHQPSQAASFSGRPNQSSSAFRPAPRPASSDGSFARQEPTYSAANPSSNPRNEIVYQKR